MGKENEVEFSARINSERQRERERSNSYPNHIKPIGNL
jgi:hypothetical protein